MLHEEVCVQVVGGAFAQLVVKCQVVALDICLKAVGRYVLWILFGQNAQSQVVGCEQSRYRQLNEFLYESERPSLLVGSVGSAKYFVE